MVSRRGVHPYLKHVSISLKYISPHLNILIRASKQSITSQVLIQPIKPDASPLKSPTIFCNQFKGGDTLEEEATQSEEGRDNLPLQRCWTDASTVASTPGFSSLGLEFGDLCVSQCQTARRSYFTLCFFEWVIWGLVFRVEWI